MSSHTDVSVIIPTYNRATLVAEAVESILAQTYDELEVIVVDDGSTDETPSVLEEYVRRDDRVRSIRQNNRGVAAARNAGLAHAKGTLMSFCDSDDLWLPNKLERQVAYLQQHPDAGLVFSDVMSVQGDQTETPSYFAERPPYAGLVFPALLERNFIPTSSVVVRKRCLDAVGGFDGSLAPSEDYDLWLRVCQRFPVGYVPEVLVKVRRHAGNLTHDERTGYRTHLAVLDRVTAQYGKQLPSGVVRRAYACTYFHMGYGEFTHARLKEAREAWVMSLRYDPICMKTYGYLAAASLPRPIVRQLRHLSTQFQKSNKAGMNGRSCR